jgi:uncharacterized protein (DUF1697 family)
MAELRDVLEGAGFGDVRTYLQSGNVVLSSKAKPETVRRKCEQLIAKAFDLDIAVVVRSRDELAEVVERNPLGKVAKNPKRYQVSFLAAKPNRKIEEMLEAAATANEQFVIIGREIYAWHPDSVRQSKLWTLLAGPKLGVAATARNWTTVTKLLELADA